MSEMNQPAGTPATIESIIEGLVPNSTGESQIENPPVDGAKPPVEEVKKDPTASRFAALTKKQRDILAKEVEVKSKEEAFNKKMESFLSNKGNPIAALEALGYSYEDATNYVLDGKVPDKVVQKQEKTEIELRLEKMEKETKEREDALAQKEFDANMNTFKQAVEGYLSQNSEEYAFLSKEKDPSKLLYDFIKEVNGSSGDKITVEQAGKELEAFLEKQAYEAFEQLQSNTKVKAKFNIALPEGELPSNKVDPKVAKGSQTLTAQMGSASSVAGKTMTDAERLEESIRIFAGKK